MKRPLARTLLLLALLVGWLSNDAAAQSDSIAQRLARQRMQPRIGIFGDAALNIHTGNHVGMPEAPNCMMMDTVAFTGGSGFGFDIGLLFELPLDPSLYLMARAGFMSLGATQSVQANIGPQATTSGELVDIISEYSLETSIGAIGVDVTLGYRPFDFPLTFRLGPEVGFLLSGTYTQQEQIASPSGASFKNADGSQSRVRNLSTGDIANTGLRVAANIAADYELPLNREETLLLVPEIAYSFALTRVRSDVDWKASQLRGGLAIKYSLPLPPPPPPPQQPPPVEEPVLNASLSAVGLGRDNTLQQNVTVKVEEFINTQTRSLLHYIFFDDSSSDIPSRYTTYGADAPSQFSFDLLHDKGTLEVYYQTLNILGRRMLDNPRATLSVTGTNSNTGAEAGNRALSAARAAAVKKYLVENWGISEKRITTSARDLPANPSSPEDPDGIAENRRVELASNMPVILEPVTTTDTLRTVDPPLLRLQPAATASTGVDRWELAISQGGRELKTFEGEGDPPATVDWDIAETRAAIPLQTAPLVSTLRVTDERGQATTATASTPVDQITIRRKREEKLGDFVYERFNLITFDFDKATITPDHERVVKMMKTRITPKSEVEITGYTDRLGEEEHNRQLSHDRAVAAAKALGVPVEKATGGGENTTLYDNDLPEGRFYSRTVDVVVKTPVEQEGMIGK